MRHPVRFALRMLLPVAGAVVLSGCYGSTEPATGVTYHGAVLHAQGTANNGAAITHFEYWATAAPGTKLTTMDRHWPSGVSGPFSETIGTSDVPLSASTAYSFRVCGSDAGGPACAQTRTFATPTPTGDSVEGSWSSSAESDPHATGGSAQAASGANGQSSHGTLRYGFRGGPPGPYDYSGTVTCLTVFSHHAVVGSVGTFNAGSGSFPASVVMAIDDGGPGIADKVGITFTNGASTASCATAPATVAQATQSANVYDAP